MQTTYDIFVNPSAIRTKIAGELVDDTEQISAKQNCWVSNASKIPITKATKRMKSSNLGLYLRL